MQAFEPRDMKMRSRSSDADLAEIVRRHWQGLYQYCRLVLNDDHMAEDAVQETFLRTYRSAGRKAEAVVRAWLFGVARRACLEMLRKRKRARLHEPESARPQETQRDDPDFTDVRTAVEGLEESQRDLVRLKHVAGMKCREIALATGLPLGTVTSTLARAYRTLRQRLSDPRGKP
jgi:RNA polymerase sigma-70 factor (ECF subfamily)